MQRVPVRPSLWRWIRPLSLAVAISIPSFAGAQHATSIQASQALSFGSFVAGSGGAVTVSPAGARSSSGGVLLVRQGAAATEARFTVTGLAGTSYSITLPSDGTVTLSSGPHAMALNGFTSQPSGSGVIPAGGSDVLMVGARLSVGAGQPAAQYQGSFTVIVNYQ